MNKKVKIAIIGAGTAGLSAYKEASKYTNEIVIIDRGPLGSTCARVGCMPSKLLLHVANQFYMRHHFSKIGITGAEQLNIHIPTVLHHVRKMRDTFTKGVIEFTESLGKNFIFGEAKFINTNTLSVGDQIISADKVIIATGTRSVVSEEWMRFGNNILTSETIFEQMDLEKNIAIIGGGSIGLELGQALSRLGVNISLFHAHEYIAGLTDPVVSQRAVNIFQNEFSIILNERVNVKKISETEFCINTKSRQYAVNQILASAGRAPNLPALNFSSLNIPCDKKGIPEFSNTTMQVENKPIFIAGDVNKMRPLLHEAADEGRIAGFNAAQDKKSMQCFSRRTPINIVFSQPNIFIVGKSFNQLTECDFVIGAANFDNQGRAKINQQNKGMLHIYVNKHDGLILGSEGIVPEGEHLAHLLAWAIQQKMTAFDILQMPFYHPVIEEGMRTALRDAAKQVTRQSQSFELAMCDSEAIHSLT